MFFREVFAFLSHQIDILKSLIILFAFFQAPQSQDPKSRKK